MPERRTPRKKGQRKNSTKHSDLYTDENPKGTIKGLGFKDAETARKGVSKVNKSNRKHAHKVQASLVMKQRSKVAKERTKDEEKKKDINAAYRVWSDHLEKLKRKTKKMNESNLQNFIREVIESSKCSECGGMKEIEEAEKCSECGEKEKTRLQLLPIPQGFSDEEQDRTVRSKKASVDGKPRQTGWRGF